jgi:hypothetical protein
MDLSSLTQVLTAPENPVEVSGDPKRWQLVEGRLGTALPADYKNFIDRYGSGRIDRFLLIFNPFAANPSVNLYSASEARIVGMRELLKNPHEKFRPRLFPQLGGVLPFGATDYGDTLYWKTGSDPDAWSIVINEARGPDVQEFEMGRLPSPDIGSLIDLRNLPAGLSKSFAKLRAPKATSLTMTIHDG